MKKFDLILALETSCDDTSVALVDARGFVRGMVSQNQDEVHSLYGGVIPELACRNHTMRILPLIQSLLSETGVPWSAIDGLAVTSKPGLIGALLVGTTVAKTLSHIHDLPVIGVNHIEGHLHAPLLSDADHAAPSDFDYPFLGLCVSGGHTSLYAVQGLGEYTLVGQTLDDAAGEAFDKFGKLLGLGYPAGAKVDKLGRFGERARYNFPRALMKKDNFDFSFSGLKTSGRLMIEKLSGQKIGSAAGVLKESLVPDLCASYQEAIVDVLVEKTWRAAEKMNLNRVAITGGVSANSRLRERAAQVLEARGLTVVVPPLRFCTDNAAMIGLVGIRKFSRGKKDSLSLSPQPFLRYGELT